MARAAVIAARERLAFVLLKQGIADDAVTAIAAQVVGTLSTALTEQAADAIELRAINNRPITAVTIIGDVEQFAHQRQAGDRIRDRARERSRLHK